MIGEAIVAIGLILPLLFILGLALASGVRVVQNTSLGFIFGWVASSVCASRGSLGSFRWASIA